jgi:hypothetical protein
VQTQQRWSVCITQARQLQHCLGFPGVHWRLLADCTMLLLRRAGTVSKPLINPNKRRIAAKTLQIPGNNPNNHRRIKEYSTKRTHMAPGKPGSTVDQRAQTVETRSSQVGGSRMDLLLASISRTAIKWSPPHLERNLLCCSLSTWTAIKAMAAIYGCVLFYYSSSPFPVGV